MNVEPATLARLAAIPNIVGVKEASGNIAQMANVIHQVPPEFIVLSGDDAITLPLMALGGRGIISVVSNEIPAEMTQLAQLCLAGDFAARPRLAAQISAADGDQFHRVQSHPGESRAGADGPARTGLPSADGAAQTGESRPHRKGAGIRRPVWGECPLQAEIESLFDHKPEAYTEEHFRLFYEFKDALNQGRIRAAEPDRAAPAVGA